MQVDTDGGLDLLYGLKGPTLRQAAFRDAPEKYRLYGGAVGGGKTVALCAEALRLTLAYPGNRGFMCRHESTAFRMTTLATLLKLIDEVEDATDAKILSNHHKTEKTLYFTNGSSMLYGALGDASDFERIKSLEIGFFCIDEASETVLENYRMLKSRLRWKLPDGTYPPFFGLMASNPEPGWVKDTFVKPAQMGVPLKNHTFIQALPSDNPYLPGSYISDLLETNPETWVRKYISGNWDSMEGQIWSEFDYATHIIKPFAIPKEWKKFRSIDHGQVHPTCCLWFALDPDSNLYVYREYYTPGTISSHCQNIQSMSTDEDYEYTILPPESWGHTLEKDSKLWSVVDEYREWGIYPIKANNEVLAGLNRVSEYMTPRPDKIHPITGNSGSPRIFIFDTCKNLILEIPDYIWKNTNSEETGKERPKKIKDDACDALRYGVMSRPSVKTLAEVVPFDSFMATRKRLIEANSLSRRRNITKHEAFDRLSRGV